MKFILAVLLLVASVSAITVVTNSKEAIAFTPANHAKSVKKACDTLTTCDKALRDGLDYGTKLPDEATPDAPFSGGMAQQALVGALLVFDRFGMRDFNTPRASVQHIHGNSLKLIKTGSGVGAPDTIASVSNKQYRNKMLEQASQFVCIALLSKNRETAGQSLGNFFHMFGDTFSPSHVERVAQTNAPSKMNHVFSMDSISWSRHVPADTILGSNFDDLVKAEESLLASFITDKKSLEDKKLTPLQLVPHATAAVRRFLKIACDHWQFTKSIDGPAGGSSGFYSHWLGSAVTPSGVVPEKDFQKYIISIDKELAAAASSGKKVPGRFSYPNPSDADYCSTVSTMLDCVDTDAAFADNAPAKGKDYGWFVYQRSKYIDRTEALKAIVQKL